MGQFVNEVDAKDIHKFIEEWHAANTNESISEYLGMTKEQYGIFIRHPEKAEQLRSPKQEIASSFSEKIIKYTK